MNAALNHALAVIIYLTNYRYWDTVLFMNYPTTLVDAVRYFRNEQVCIDEVAAMRWPDGEISCSN